jgi:hypothetical protein
MFLSFCRFAGSDFIQQLIVTVTLHGLVNTLKVCGKGFVQLKVVEVSMPLEAVTCWKLRKCGITTSDKCQTLKVLGDGLMIESTALIC